MRAISASFHCAHRFVHWVRIVSAACVGLILVPLSVFRLAVCLGAISQGALKSSIGANWPRFENTGKRDDNVQGVTAVD